MKRSGGCLQLSTMDRPTFGPSSAAFAAGPLLGASVSPGGDGGGGGLPDASQRGDDLCRKRRCDPVAAPSQQVFEDELLKAYVLGADHGHTGSDSEDQDHVGMDLEQWSVPRLRGAVQPMEQGVSWIRRAMPVLPPRSVMQQQAIHRAELIEAMGGSIPETPPQPFHRLHVSPAARPAPPLPVAMAMALPTSGAGTLIGTTTTSSSSFSVEASVDVDAMVGVVATHAELLTTATPEAAMTSAGLSSAPEPEVFVVPSAPAAQAAVIAAVAAADPSVATDVPGDGEKITIPVLSMAHPSVTEAAQTSARQNSYRKEFFVKSLQTKLSTLWAENQRLKELAKAVLPPARSGPLLQECSFEVPAIFRNAASDTLDKASQDFVSVLQAAQRSYVITDPNQPDNPIVWVSPAFCKLTGFEKEEILGRNCRFLQGPATNPAVVRSIRKSIEGKYADSFLIINYTKSGRPFWNQLYVTPLHGQDNQVVNYVGCQCDVTAAEKDVVHERESNLIPVHWKTDA